MKATQSQRRPAGQARISTVQILLVVGAAVLGVALLIVLNTGRLRQATGGALAYQTGITADGHPYKGSPDAPLKLTLHSDFLCSHCAEFAATLEALSHDYIETGKLQVVFYNFAFLTPESMQAAKAALCALDQDAAAFWSYHDVLYSSRDGGTVAYSNSRLKEYARQLGLNIESFTKCFESDAEAAHVQADRDAGLQSGVEGTPTWFLDGQKHVGAMSESDLRQLLDDTLKK
jgi:protein-disulfide isomerase